MTTARGFPTMREVSDAMERAREEGRMTDLRFTSDDIRAMGNALDRAEIKVSEGDPFDSDDEHAYLDNQRDVAIAQAMWARIRPTLGAALPLGTLASGSPRRYLCCPNGHDGPFRYQEPVWTTRDVRGLNDDGMLMVEGPAEVQWNAVDGHATFFHCDTCDAEFDLPPGLEVNWT